MCILLFLTIVFQFTIKFALKHEEARLAYADPTPTGGHINGHHEDGLNTMNGEKMHTTQEGNNNTNLAPRASRMPAFLRKLFNPEKQSIHALSVSLDQFYHSPQEPLPIEIQKRAFFNPSVTSPTPVLWIVHDDMGISTREIRDTQKAVPGLIITDEQAVFNEKGKVYWKGVEDGKSREAPVFDERIVY
jgi:hypothetical protein